MYLNWLNWFQFLILKGVLLVILIDCMIFLSTIPTCYKDVCVKSFFPRTARLWNSPPIECFPLTYVTFRFFLNRFPVCLNIFVLLFLVTLCLIVAVLPCMERIPNFFFKKKLYQISITLCNP